MKTQLYLVVQLAVAAAIAYSVMCRLTKTDADTHREIRWAFVFELACAGMVAGAPFLPLLMPEQAHWKPGTTPTWVWLLLLLSVWLVQVVTARYWREGVPQCFQRSHGPRPRSILPALAATGLALVVGLLVAGPQIVVAKAAAEVPPPARPQLPFHLVPYGQSGTCVAHEGCAAMTLRDLKVLLDSAEAYGAAVTCGKKPST